MEPLLLDGDVLAPTSSPGTSPATTPWASRESSPCLEATQSTPPTSQPSAASSQSSLPDTQGTEEDNAPRNSPRKRVKREDSSSSSQKKGMEGSLKRTKSLKRTGSRAKLALLPSLPLDILFEVRPPVLYPGPRLTCFSL